VEARLIGFADDVAIVVTAKKLPDAKRICNEAGKRASAWLDSKGLALAALKTEAVLISSRQKVEAAVVISGGIPIDLLAVESANIRAGSTGVAIPIG